MPEPTGSQARTWMNMNLEDRFLPADFFPALKHIFCEFTKQSLQGRIILYLKPNSHLQSLYLFFFLLKPETNLYQLVANTVKH